MFRFYVHALRFAHLQRQTRSIVPKTDNTPKNKPMLLLPTHMRASAHPLLFQSPRAKTLCDRSPQPVRTPVGHTRDKRL